MLTLAFSSKRRCTCSIVSQSHKHGCKRIVLLCTKQLIMKLISRLIYKLNIISWSPDAQACQNWNMAPDYSTPYLNIFYIWFVVSVLFTQQLHFWQRILSVLLKVLSVFCLISWPRHSTSTSVHPVPGRVKTLPVAVQLKDQCVGFGGIERRDCNQLNTPPLVPPFPRV